MRRSTALTFTKWTMTSVMLFVAYVFAVTSAVALPYRPPVWDPPTPVRVGEALKAYPQADRIFAVSLKHGYSGGLTVNVGIKEASAVNAALVDDKFRILRALPATLNPDGTVTLDMQSAPEENAVAALVYMDGGVEEGGRSGGVRQLKGLEAILRWRDADVPNLFLRHWLADLMLRDYTNGSLGDGRVQAELAAWQETLDALRHEAFHPEGHFWICTGKKALLFANSKIGIGFAPLEEGAGIISLYHFETGAEFISQRPSPAALWEIDILQRAENVAQGKGGLNAAVAAARENSLVHRLVESSDTPPPTYTINYTDGEQTLLLLLMWRYLPVPTAGGSLEVMARLSLTADEPELRMRVDITNTFSCGGLWQINFPIIDNLGYAGESDYASSTSGPFPVWGELVRGARGRQTHVYMGNPSVPTHPSAYWGMQFITISAGPSTLLIGAEDPLSTPKAQQCVVGEELRLIHWPENIALPGKREFQPYETVLRFIKGDWFDAAKAYRSWALKQRWCSKGPLAQRKDVPEALKNLDFWMRPDWDIDEQHYKKEQRAQLVLDAAEYFGSPIGVHWYNWQSKPFDRLWPDWFPIKPGFAEVVKDEAQRGLLPMPYLVGSPYWDPFAPGYPREEAFLNLDGSGPEVGNICPTGQKWQAKMLEVGRRMHEETNAPLLYLDILSNWAPPAFCFDSTHGHPLGSGDWIVNHLYGYLTRLREAVPGVRLTSENSSEAYIAHIDAFLLWMDRSNHIAPLIPAVYGGYTILFGCKGWGAPRVTTYAAMIGRDFLFGGQLGIFINEWIMTPEGQWAREMVRRLVRLRSQTRDFLAFGEMIRPPRWASAPPVLDCPDWVNWGETEGCRIDALERTAWKATDGRIAVFVFNADEKECQAELLLGDLLGPGEKHQIEQLNSDGSVKPLGEAFGTQAKVSVLIPPLDAVALIMERPAVDYAPEQGG